MEYKTKNLNLNLTSRTVINFIFKPESLPFLIRGGLINVYLDDYGYHAKHNHCLFFLFNLKNKDYLELEDTVTDFKSFFDWYDVGEDKRMLVYKVGVLYRKDLQKFKCNMLENLSRETTSLIPSLNKNLNLNYSEEIYRYNLCGN
jgi:hypothetical protein